MSFRFKLLLALSGVSLLVSGQTRDVTTSSISPLRQLYIQDQRDRGVLLTDQGARLPASTKAEHPKALSASQLQRNDENRRKIVSALLREGKVTSAIDFHDAAYIFQHGQTPDDYLLAHILAVEAVIKGDVTSKWISAASLDRYLQAIGQSQVFGTQYSDRDFAFIIKHRNDPSALKAHRHEPGMSLEPYNRTMMPDSLRLDFCVPALAQQGLNLKDFEAGRTPKGILPPGCSR